VSFEALLTIRIATFLYRREQGVWCERDIRGAQYFRSNRKGVRLWFWLGGFSFFPFIPFPGSGGGHVKKSLQFRHRRLIKFMQPAAAFVL
jgi:hypothetical protein